jgi:hypothetical protein
LIHNRLGWQAYCRIIKKGDAFPIAGSIACSKKDLHPPFVRESFLILMRREIARALGLIVVGFMTSLLPRAKAEELPSRRAVGVRHDFLARSEHNPLFR